MGTIIIYFLSQLLILTLSRYREYGDKMAALLSSHPPVEKRIERLRNMQRELERPSIFTGI